MIYVLVAQGFEEIEALAAVDILRRAELSVQMAGVGGKTVVGAHGISVNCDLLAEEITPKELEMIVLPGGMPGTLNLEHNEAVRELCAFCAKNDRWIAAICAAPSILGHMGLLRGRTATCYPGFTEQLEGAVLGESPVCVDGKYVTGKGPGVSIPFALKLVELLCGAERAELLKNALQCER